LGKFEFDESMSSLNKIKIQLLLILTFPAFLFAQKARIVDLKVRILSPIKNSYIKSPGTLDLTFSVFNKGPDNIKLNDTIVYYASSPDSFFKFKKINPNKEIIVGDSDVFVFLLPFNSKYDMNFYEVGIASLYAYNFSKDSLRNETINMRKDNKDFVALRHRSATSKISNQFIRKRLELFPNPSNDMVSITLPNLSSKLNQIIVSDNLGRLIKYYNIENFNSEVTYSVLDLKNGLYNVTIIDGNYVHHSKLLILHE